MYVLQLLVRRALFPWWFWSPYFYDRYWETQHSSLESFSQKGHIFLNLWIYAGLFVHAFLGLCGIISSGWYYLCTFYFSCPNPPFVLGVNLQRSNAFWWLFSNESPIHSIMPDRGRELSLHSSDSQNLSPLPLSTVSTRLPCRETRLLRALMHVTSVTWGAFSFILVSSPRISGGPFSILLHQSPAPLRDKTTMKLLIHF